MADEVPKDKESGIPHSQSSDEVSCSLRVGRVMWVAGCLILL